MQIIPSETSQGKCTIFHLQLELLNKEAPCTLQAQGPIQP